MQHQKSDGDEIYFALISMLEQITNTEVSSVDLSTELREIPALDSLDFIRFIVEIEQAFSLQFDVKELTSNLTLGEICGIVRSRAARQGEM